MRFFVDRAPARPVARRRRGAEARREIRKFSGNFADFRASAARSSAARAAPPSPRAGAAIARSA
jgi:hypothetical protein